MNIKFERHEFISASLKKLILRGQSVCKDALCRFSSRH